jgi:hypothetical protein
VEGARRVRCQTCNDADPAQVPALRASRGRAIARARARDRELAEGGGLDWEAVRAALAGVGLKAVMGACGVSKSTAWSWKTGRTVPAPGHWGVLARLGLGSGG